MDMHVCYSLCITNSDLSEVGVVLACLQPQPLPQLRTGACQQVVEHVVVPGEVKGQRSAVKQHEIPKGHVN